MCPSIKPRYIAYKIPKSKLKNFKVRAYSNWFPCGSLIHSEYGYITYLSWCRKEMRRIGQGLKIITGKHKGGKVCALFITSNLPVYNLPRAPKRTTGEELIKRYFLKRDRSIKLMCSVVDKN